MALDETLEAQNKFSTALKLAQQGGLIPPMLDALLGLAIVDSRQITDKETFELVLYILEHPASAQDTKKRAQQLKIELASRLSQDEIKAAQQHAKTKNLDEVVRKFLASA